MIIFNVAHSLRVHSSNPQRFFLGGKLPYILGSKSLCFYSLIPLCFYGEISVFGFKLQRFHSLNP